MPGVTARTGLLRQSLTVPICARHSAEIGSIAGTMTGHEEGHVGLLRLQRHYAEQKSGSR
jgi:hypothetical protein